MQIKNYMKRFCALGAFLFLSIFIFQVSTCMAQQRVPANPRMMEMTQPNGYVLRTFLRGDEHRHWRMTEDGWQIIETDKGWFKYAKTNCKGQVVKSWRKAHNVEDRSKCEKIWLEKHGIMKGKR